MVDLVGKDLLDRILDKGADGLKDCYTKVMRSSTEDISECIQKLDNKFTAQPDQTELSSIFLQLNKDFPNDVGSLSLFFLNIMNLAPGEAIFLDAKLPHAYLAGDCIECMACSDNVVRAGLTPKYKDVDTLLDMLVYEGKPKADMIFKPETLVGDQKFTELFLPPVEDFAVGKVVIPKTESSYKITNSAFGSIILTLSGRATISGKNMVSLMLQRGSIVFLPSNVGPKLSLDIEAGDEDFVLYQAFYNDF
jgi:mannose-6-phosphate isomerase